MFKRSDKTRPTSLLDGFKTIPVKRAANISHAQQKKKKNRKFKPLSNLANSGQDSRTNHVKIDTVVVLVLTESTMTTINRYSH